jgi:NADP-dependent 3-hydroxy acid dehydrogenase YdfG
VHPAASAPRSQKALHAQGAIVAISGTRKDALDAVAAEMKDRVHVLPCNLSDPAAVEALIPSANEKMERVDILVNNAGITKRQHLHPSEGRRLGSGDRSQPHRDLQARSRRCEGT